MLVIGDRGCTFVIFLECKTEYMIYAVYTLQLVAVHRAQNYIFIP